MQTNKLLVVWYNPNDNSHYYKIVNGYYYQNYHEGYVNGYGHMICIVIPVTFKIPRDSPLKRLIRRVIVFLENLLQKMR